MTDTVQEIKRESANGVPVYICENRALHGFCLSLFVRAGAIYENEENEGTGHFLEHVAIRNLNAYFDGKLYEALDRYGLELNASTYREMIQFYVIGAAKHAERAARILSTLLNPICLPREEIEAERGRIKAEIRESDERDSLSSFSAKTLYAGTPLANSIVGNAKSVSAVTARKLESYRRLAMSRGNLFFVFSGSVPQDAVETLLRETEKYEVYPAAARDTVLQKPVAFGNRQAGVYLKSADYTVLRFQFDLDMGKVGVAQTDMLYDVMFSGNSSLFFTELSEKRGLCYDITGAVERFANIGAFTFTVETKSRDVYEVAELSVKLLCQLKTDLLPEGKMPYAVYTDNAGMLADDCVETNFTFGYEAHILGLGYRTLEERRAAYLAVTPESLRRTAREVFTRDNFALTLKGDKNRIDVARLSAIFSNL